MIRLTIFLACRFHDNAHKLHTVFFRKSHKRISGSICKSCLSAYTVFVTILWILIRIYGFMMIKPYSLCLVLICFCTCISRCITNFSEYGIFKCSPSNHRHIICRCIMIWVRKSIWVIKMCIFKTKLFYTLIHKIDKILYTP